MIDAISSIINTLNGTIKTILNSRNIIDFRDENQTGNINLDNLNKNIPCKRVNGQNGIIKIISNTKEYNIKDSVYNPESGIMILNIGSLLPNNSLADLIKLLYDNPDSLKSFFNNQIIKYTESINEPKPSLEYESLDKEIKFHLQFSKNQNKGFIVSQIENFDQKYGSLREFEKKKINSLF